MAMAYGPCMVGMVFRNASEVSAKVEEGLHAHTSNVFKNASKDTYVKFCHAADGLGPRAAPSKNAALEEELVRLREDKKEKDGQLQQLQQQMAELQQLFMKSRETKDDGEPQKKKKKKKKDNH